MARTGWTRRDLLKALIPTLAGLVGCWRYLTPRQTAAAAEVSVPLVDVPAGGALVLPEAGLAVTRTGDGAIQAFDLTCTHLGCRVTATEAGFTCPCHGSRFDREGRVLTGPAPRSLRTLGYRERDGVLLVQRPESA